MKVAVSADTKIGIADSESHLWKDLEKGRSRGAVCGVMAFVDDTVPKLPFQEDVQFVHSGGLIESERRAHLDVRGV